MTMTEEDKNMMQFIGTKEIAELMGCSVPVARQIMRRKTGRNAFLFESSGKI